MATIQEIRQAIEAELTAAIGVTDWDTVAFSMLPSDDPTGFLYLLECTPAKTTKTAIFAVGIGVAESTLSALFTTTDNLVDAIANTYGKQRVTCSGINGTIRLLDSIEVEIPDSYVNQNVQSSTDAFKTAVVFRVQVEVGY